VSEEGGIVKTIYANYDAAATNFSKTKKFTWLADIVSWPDDEMNDSKYSLFGVPILTWHLMQFQLKAEQFCKSYFVEGRGTPAPRPMRLLFQLKNANIIFVMKHSKSVLLYPKCSIVG